MIKRAVMVLGTAAFWSGQSLAQAPAPPSDTELSKDVENPVTRQITLPLRYEADFNDGAYKATKDTFEIDQAVVPFRLNEDWALITRTKLPLEALPPKKLGDHWAFGLSNGYTTFFLSPEHGEGFYWGAGPVLYYPSATNSALGVNKWGSGPSAAFVKKDESPWVFGAGRQQHLVLRRAARQRRPNQPALTEPLRQLSFWRRMVRRLVAEHHDQLDREWRKMDSSGRRRLWQGDPAG
jgi:hypothetical protein